MRHSAARARPIRRIAEASAAATSIVQAQHRRTAVRVVALAAICAILPNGAAADPLRLEEIAPGLFVHVAPVALAAPDNGGDIANLVAVVGSRAVAVVDAGGTTKVGADFLAAIRVHTALPVSHVILTHMHPDHVLGAAAFRGSGPGGADPTVVAHAAFGEALASRVAAYRDQVARELGPDAAAAVEPVFPTATVADSLALDLGDRTLRVDAWPTAHTNNDLTVLDPASATLIAGDLVFAEHLPVVDGSLRGWLRVLDRLAALPATRVVPGHGPVLPFPDALAPERAYLEQLAAAVRDSIAAGDTMAETVARVPPPPGWRLTDDFHRRNVTAATAELEWE